MLKLDALWAWRSHASAGQRAVPRASEYEPIELVRSAMQELLQELGAGASPRLVCSIEVASDVRTLWHLRPALMQALASECGESAARRRIRALDGLFLESWPKAPVSRPAVLG